MSRFLFIRRLASITAALAWTAIIPMLSLLPPSFFSGANKLTVIPGMDKIVHALIYGIQTALLIGAWRSIRPDDQFMIWKCAAAATAYGALMEVLQRACTTSRQFSWGDLAANAAGALLAMALVAGWTALMAARRR